ncbi:LysR family transcriptional regulator [Rhodoferax sp.]|uniref:LysR family transcriptional regulator n=1 Tax=Rhodoferax sp. TaxID=50421 RepID=UPI0025FB132E|nr:LysR family transcriptional regulator [Rhodoferax sp.]MCM2339729.1 LysR family transcriptional regulator [Rhodoferax sp.]
MAIDIVTSMRVFNAVVDVGSFAGAAERLNISRGMSTRYVAQLEGYLGVRLLNRTTRKLSLTEAGNDYHERATQVLAMIEEAESSVAQEESVPRGTLRVASSHAFGVRHLGWAITEYLHRYPGVQIDVTLNDRVVDLVEEGFDLGIRVASQIHPGLIARKLARARIVACASPDYLKKHGVPKSPMELIDHNCLSYAYVNLPNEWHFRRKGSAQKVHVPGNLRGNSGDILRNAAIEGLGVILQPTFLIYEALREKKLVRILSDWETDDLTVFAVYPNRKFLSPKVRSFIDFLAERFGPEPYWDFDIKPCLDKAKA